MPAWVTSLVREATSEEVERQKRAAEDKDARWRREHPDDAAAFDISIRAFAELATRRRQKSGRR